MRLLPALVLMAALAGCGGGGSAPATTPGGARSPDGSGASTSLRYAVLGDSYSNGEAVGLDRSWPAVMADRLTRDGLPVQVVANPSVTGATTAEMLRRGLPAIRAAHPDVMTVMLGVNDQVQGRTTAQFAVDADRALAAAIGITGSAARVLAVDIPDYSVAPVSAQFGDRRAISQQIDAFNAVVREVAARRQVRVVSIVDLSRQRGAAGIAGDGLHPSAEQLAAWADRIGAVARRRWARLRPTG
ncbi:MAG: GDSL-type esterase/lipase family protein [Patulibacter minatonensis]